MKLNFPIRLVLLVALLGAYSVGLAEDASPSPLPGMPAMPGPTKEHAWLQQFAGEWESEAELVMAPGQPPMVVKGTQAARMVGGFWVMELGQGDFPGMGPVSTVLTIGYDAARQKFVGTWIDSTNDRLWHYEGGLDPSGKKLVLETEGPSPTDPAKTARYRDETEFPSADHRILRSSIQGDDGAWVVMLTAHYRRKS